MLVLSTRVARRALLAASLVALAPDAFAQPRLTTPKEHFGFAIGDDYKLATYTQFESYWRKLATQSNRMKLVEIGRTAENRPQLMAIISSPANLARLDHYRSIAGRLAHGEGSEEAARALAKEGKAVVWIDGGLHATEVLGAAQLIETSYQLLSRTDAETQRFLNDCIILAVHANPDGMELVSNWYMQEADTLKRNTNIPRLYQKYVGHDNNRDFYMSAQPESRNINHVLYQQWYPHIVYNHHQTGPAGTVMFAPPFRDPFNYNYDPLVVVQLDLVGAAMHSRFEAEGKPGVTMRSGATYSTWWNGGLRTTPYFHNMVGLLTETIGHPTPMTIPFIPEQQLPRADLPYPIAPQRWHFRQSIDYSVTANRAVLDIASRQRENFLFNAWRMARNSIERGSRDHWTTTPSDVDSAKAAVERLRVAAAAGPAPARPAGGVVAVGDPIFQFGRGSDPRVFTEVLRAPARRDARGYILSAAQPDFLTATKFIHTLQHNGVTVHRATAPFAVAGRQYPRGSYVVKAAQAFRPMVLDMFEPQDHPNDFAYPGGPPKRPYDNAGYTLAYQMGVQFDRVVEGFDGPFERIDGLATPPAGTVANAAGAAGFLVSHATNDAWVAVNRALKANGGVHVLRSPLTSNGRVHQAGTFYITASPAIATMLSQVARSHGLSAEGTTVRVPSDARLLRPVRIALWDQYGGSMPSGHTRFLLEQFEFPYELVYPRTLDAGNLASRYDVILLPSGAVQAREGQGRGNFGNEDESAVPAEYRERVGRITVARTVPQLRQFLEAGGTVVAVGSSASLGMHMGLPMTDALTERTAEGTVRPLGADRFYVPGSILRVQADTTGLVGYGMPGEVDVFFDNSPSFRLGSDAAAQGIRPLAWFTSRTPLRSGWAWGQENLNGAVAAAQATVGKGTLLMFGPEITFRAQPHGTFKWLFNGIHAGGATLTP
ncbi:MAG: peptidase carboxypeptidase [Gemmatimonadetes bacterium]|jgi:hypothetical protein|nr:peptidase carboxypeptidase [Gemmatimonadota bacterium]